MSLFDNGKQEEFFLFMRNFSMNIVASGTMEKGTKIKYPRTLVHGEALRQLDSLSHAVKCTEKVNMKYIIKGLALCPPPCKLALKKSV